MHLQIHVWKRRVTAWLESWKSNLKMKPAWKCLIYLSVCWMYFRKGLKSYFWNSTKELLIWVITCELGLRGFMSHLATDTWINLATSLAYFWKNLPLNNTSHYSPYMVPSWKFINVQWDGGIKCIRYVKSGYWFWRKLKKSKLLNFKQYFDSEKSSKASQVRAHLMFIYIYIQEPTRR